MRVLVTGAAGFIGSHTAEALCKRGDTVLGVDNLNDYYSVAQKEENLAILQEQEGFSFKRIDIRDAEMRTAIKEFRPDMIIHLAARAGVRPSLTQPELYYDVNVMGTLNILEGMRLHGCKRLIFGSSSSVYGSRSGGKFAETDRVDTPISPYAATKKAGEELCHVHHALHGFDIACLRFFTVYGPRGRPDMAPYKFLKAMLNEEPITRYGNGSSSRDYTYVGDIVAGILLALEKTSGYTLLNLGSDSPVTLNEFIAAVESVTGKQAIVKEGPSQPGDVPYTGADIRKANSLGYHPETSLHEGLAAMKEWYDGRDA